MKKIYLVTCLLTLLIGCGDDDDDGPETIVQENFGAVCIAQNPEPFGGEVTVSADQPTRVSVLFQGCASDCIDEFEKSCSVEFDSATSTITVTSRASWKPQDVDVCNDSCRVIETTCDGPTLPEGTYTVVHGESEETLTVPSTYQCAASFP